MNKCSHEKNCNTYNQTCSKISPEEEHRTWFNTPFSLNLKTKVTKMFLQLIGTYFPPANKLEKIFSRNTVKVSYIQNI